MMRSMMFWLVACAVSVVIPRLAFSTNKSVSFARFIRIKLNKSHRECFFVSTFITYSLNFFDAEQHLRRQQDGSQEAKVYVPISFLNVKKCKCNLFTHVTRKSSKNSL